MLDGIFDYAGEFPPASEPFLKALTLSGNFPKTLKRPWLVGADLVTNVSRTAELCSLNLNDYGFESGRTLKVCFLGNENQCRSLESFNHIGPDGVLRKISGFEMRSSPTIEINAPYLLAYEVDLLEADWKDIFQYKSLALKLRANGPTAISREKMAKVLAIACDKQFNLKVTGEHHHPIIETERYNNKFGFLNLAFAVFLTRALGSKSVNILEILENEDPEAFSFDTNKISYKNLSITKEQLIAAKNAAHFSIGSCSLHEPDHDLVRLFGNP